MGEFTDREYLTKTLNCFNVKQIISALYFYWSESVLFSRAARTANQLLRKSWSSPHWLLGTGVLTRLWRLTWISAAFGYRYTVFLYHVTSGFHMCVDVFVLSYKEKKFKTFFHQLCRDVCLLLFITSVVWMKMESERNSNKHTAICICAEWWNWM